jgi:hypothetical protein
MVGVDGAADVRPAGSSDLPAQEHVGQLREQDRGVNPGVEKRLGGGDPAGREAALHFAEVKAVGQRGDDLDLVARGVDIALEDAGRSRIGGDGAVQVRKEEDVVHGVEGQVVADAEVGDVARAHKGERFDLGGLAHDVDEVGRNDEVGPFFHLPVGAVTDVGVLGELVGVAARVPPREAEAGSLEVLGIEDRFAAGIADRPGGARGRARPRGAHSCRHSRSRSRAPGCRRRRDRKPDRAAAASLAWDWGP